MAVGDAPSNAELEREVTQTRADKAGADRENARLRRAGS